MTRAGHGRARSLVRAVGAAALLAALAEPAAAQGEGDEGEGSKPPKVIGVLEVEDQGAGLESGQLEQVTDWMRGAARKAVPDATVISREKLTQFARSNDVKWKKCMKNEGCALKVGRILQAGYVVTSSVTRMGDKLSITMKLHETAKGGRFVNVESVQVAGLGALHDPLHEAADGLFAPIRSAEEGGSKFAFQGGELEGLGSVDLAQGMDLSGVNIDAIEAYDEAMEAEESDASPHEKAKEWSRFAEEHPEAEMADKAEMRAKQWLGYARDWEKLSRLLDVDVVSTRRKRELANGFVDAYGFDMLSGARARKLCLYLGSRHRSNCDEHLEAAMSSTQLSGAYRDRYARRTVSPVGLFAFELFLGFGAGSFKLGDVGWGVTGLLGRGVLLPLGLGVMMSRDELGDARDLSGIATASVGAGVALAAIIATPIKAAQRNQRIERELKREQLRSAEGADMAAGAPSPRGASPPQARTPAWPSRESARRPPGMEAPRQTRIPVFAWSF